MGLIARVVSVNWGINEEEKAMILKSLRHHQGNISRVAQALGLSRAALYRRLEKYEIPV